MSAESLIEALTGPAEGDASESVPTRMKAYAWARVSTDMQEERGLSIPEQHREIRKYAEKNDIEIVAEFHETASAFQKDEKRVEFHRMIDAALKDREIRAIVIHDFSRFSRDSVKGKALLRKLQKSGIKVISLNDPEMDTETSGGVFIEAITFAKNEAYSRDVAMHTKKGCRSNIQARDQQTGWCYKNGGRALWGYKNERLIRGEANRGGSNIKLIWLPDDTIVHGKPVREWARYCLVELAANGASLKNLRDFCNNNQLPSTRGKGWNISTWHALLQPNTLLQYAGYGVWNVHRKNGTKRPPSEWTIVENAHEALITEDEAKMIMEARRKNSRLWKSSFFVGATRESPYLLSGGLFACGRCGANMTGYRANSRSYYICGSHPNRGGFGCGPGVYVPKKEIEDEVLDGLMRLMDICGSRKGFIKDVNDHLRSIWESKSGFDPYAKRSCDGIDAKIANIRNAIEDGLSDAAWANERLKDLVRERDRIMKSRIVLNSPPKIDMSEVAGYRHQLDDVMQSRAQFEKKKLLASWIQEIKLAPDNLDVTIRYRLPEPFVPDLVAGARSQTAPLSLLFPRP